MNFNKVTIIGSGQGALACAADMVLLRDKKVTLFDFPEFEENLTPLKKINGVNIQRDGKLRFAKLDSITTDIKTALSGADLIMPVVPTLAHRKIAEEIAPYITSQQTVILNPGSTGGALEFLNVFRSNGEEIPYIAETSTLPYGVRKLNHDTVKVLLDINELWFSALPAIHNEYLYEGFKELYPRATLVKNTLEIGLNNGNPISHPAGAILNAGRIEDTKGDYLHYREGISPSVAHVMDILDKERLSICESYQINGVSTSERLSKLGYANEGKSLYEQYHTSEVFAPMKAPSSLRNRFIMEDIPYGLVMWESLANAAGVKAPMMNALITLAEGLLKEDFRETGRSLSQLSLDHFSQDELMLGIEKGFSRTSV